MSRGVIGRNVHNHLIGAFNQQRVEFANLTRYERSILAHQLNGLGGGHQTCDYGMEMTTWVQKHFINLSYTQCPNVLGEGSV